MQTPRFQNAYLAELSKALKKRLRAIKFKTSGVDLDRVVEQLESRRREVMELNIDLLVPPKSRIGISVWEDRWIDVNVRVSSKSGLLLDWRESGRFLLGSGKMFVEAIEKSIDSAAKSEKEAIASLNQTWLKKIAKGPRTV